jgi:hypothetical protein
MSSTSIKNGDVINAAAVGKSAKGRRSTPVPRGLTNSASESRSFARPAERVWRHQSGWSWPREGVVEDHRAAGGHQVSLHFSTRRLHKNHYKLGARQVAFNNPLGCCTGLSQANNKKNKKKGSPHERKFIVQIYYP